MNIKNTDKSRLTFIDKFEENMIKIEEKINMPRRKFLIGMGFSIFCIFIGFFDIYFSYFITIYYPVIWSLQILHKKEKKSDDDKLWLTYWVIFSIFVLFDMVSPYLTIIVPFYFFIRTMVLLWLYLPNFKGAVIVYNLYFVEFLKLSQKLQIHIVKEEFSQAQDSLKAEVESIMKKREEILMEEKETYFFESNTNNVSNVNNVNNINEKKNN